MVLAYYGVALISLSPENCHSLTSFTRSVTIAPGKRLPARQKDRPIRNDRHEKSGIDF